MRFIIHFIVQLKGIPATGTIWHIMLLNKYIYFTSVAWQPSCKYGCDADFEMLRYEFLTKIALGGKQFGVYADTHMS